MLGASHSQILRTIPFLIAVCFTTFPAQGKYSGGTGEPNDPYRIATATDLIALGSEPNDYDKHFILTADIDLDPNLPGRRVFDKAVVALATYNEETSQFEGTPFSGMFDGNGRTISHLTVTGTSCLGLFGHLNGAEVRDVRLIDPNVDGSYYVGALAGWLEDGAIIDCAVTGGYAAANSTVGGLVGCQDGGSVISCSVAGAHVAAANGTVGGLVGTQAGGNISDCSVTGGGISGTIVAGGLVGRGPWLDGTIVRCSVQNVQVQAYDPIQQLGFIGGLVGWAGSCTISDCHVTGGIVHGAGEVGGVIGLINEGTITGCYTATHVEANGGEERYAPCLVVGGLAGLNAGTIENCYTTSSVSQGEIIDDPNSHFLEGAGGLAGCNRGKIDRSYSTGAITGTKCVGGLVGDDPEGSVTRCLWDTQTSGQARSGGGTGKTTVEMQTAKTFLDAGWDFVGETANGTEDIWWINEGKDYPRLRWQGPAGIVFVDIPAGTFQMGNHHDVRPGNARPVHAVTLDAFQISKYETTNGQYAEYLNAAVAGGLIQVVNGAVYASSDANLAEPYCDTCASSSYSQIEYSQGRFTVRSGDGNAMSDHPVARVSWYGAKAFCDYYGCRLPTEAEWEYAARGGYHDPCYRYPWGDDSIDCSKANCKTASGFCNPLSLTSWPYTVPVGYYGPQGAYGLCDMSGNLWEWCQDWYDAGYYSVSPASNPTGPAGGTYRVLRGGAWDVDGNSCDVEGRAVGDPLVRGQVVGFRVCR